MVYTTSNVFIQTLVEAGITHAFVNLGSDHPGEEEQDSVATCIMMDSMADSKVTSVQPCLRPLPREAPKASNRPSS